MKGHPLFIEEAVTKPKTFQSDINKFASPNRYAILEPGPVENESDFEIMGASNFNISENFGKKYIKQNDGNNIKSDKRRGQVIVNNHPENQTLYGKSIIRPGHKTYSEAVKPIEIPQRNKDKENVLIFSDSIPGKMKMYEFNKQLKNSNVKHLFFPGATSEQLLQYLDVNLNIYSPKTVILHVGINDLLNDSGDSNVEKLLKNFNEMIKKCRVFNVKNILLSGLVYCKRVALPLLEKLHLKVVELCSQNGVTYIDNRNIYSNHLYQDNLHLLHSGKRILLNNFISNLNFLTDPQICSAFT